MFSKAFKNFRSMFELSETTCVTVSELHGTPFKQDSMEITIALLGKSIGYVETRNELRTNTCLWYNHFAIESNSRGSGAGKLAAVAFAHHVSKTLPHVTEIKFDLRRQGKDSDDPILLRDARINLFESLGATCSAAKIDSIRDPVPRWTVAVVWPKSSWPPISSVEDIERAMVKRRLKDLSRSDRLKYITASTLRSLFSSITRRSAS
jgi:hypothetical protein